MGEQRRSTKEKELSDHIQDVSKSRTAHNKEAAARAEKYARAAMGSKRFESIRNKSKIDGLHIHRFRQSGETVEGILGEKRSEWWGESTIPLVLDSGRIILLPGNKRLLKSIKKADATFRRCKITYTGKLFTGLGHYEKVYLVEIKDE